VSSGTIGLTGVCVRLRVLLMLLRKTTFSDGSCISTCPTVIINFVYDVTTGRTKRG